MKGYGLPRNDDISHPDKGDITKYGLKGERRKSSAKRRHRRIWKKKERKHVKEEIKRELDSLE